MSATIKTADMPELPERKRSMFCTMCGYQNPETEAAAGLAGAPCENSNCQYSAFVTERDYTADQMRKYGRQCASLAAEQAEGEKAPLKISTQYADAEIRDASGKLLAVIQAGEHQARMLSALAAPSQPVGSALKLAEQSGAYVEYEHHPARPKKLLRITFAPGHWEAFVAALTPEPAALPAEVESDDRLIALAEKCSAEVGRYEGQVVWVKFHSLASVEAFSAGVVMSAALKTRPATAAQPAGAVERIKQAHLHLADMHEGYGRNHEKTMAARVAFYAELDSIAAQPAAAEPVEAVSGTWWFKELDEFWHLSPDQITAAIKMALDFIRTQAAATVAAAAIDPLQNPMRPGYFMNYAEDETPAEMALRKLACWLGVGGFNAPKVDADAFHRKIVEAVIALAVPAQAAAVPIEAYRQMVARCIELGEKLVAKQAAAVPEAVERDAARYQWVRDNFDKPWPEAIMRTRNREDLDAAIDRLAAPEAAAIESIDRRAGQ